MTRSAVTVLSLAVLLAVFKTGSCSSCYQCNSQSQAGCADPFDSKNIKLQDCNNDLAVSDFNNNYVRPLLAGVHVNVAGATKYCHKIVSNTDTILRVCLEDNPYALNTTCQMIAAKVPMVKHCSVCEKDGCNGAGSLSASLSLAIAALFASYFYLKQ